MTLIGAIVAFGPLSVFGVLVCLVAMGLAWSPFAAAIMGHLAQRRGLNGRRYALVGAAYSAFLLVPWIQLFWGLLSRRAPGFVGPVYFLLYFSWLIGPIVFWGQYVAEIELLQTLGIGDVSNEEELAPLQMLFVYCVFVAMILAWCGSVIISFRKPTDVVVIPTKSFSYISPFALAWVCTLAVGVYWFL